MLTSGNYSKNKKIKGFTLIELLIVLAILAIMMTMAASSFNTFRQNSNLREAAAAVISDIKLAKQRAMAENVTYALRCTLDDDSVYWMGKFNEATDSFIGSPKTVDMNIYGSEIGFVGMSSLTYVFQPRGTCTAGYLILQNITKRIQIDITTMGKVTLGKIY